MSSKEHTEEETVEKPQEEVVKITRAVNIEFEMETGKILDIFDKDVRLAILETKEDGSIVRLVPPIPLVQELAIVVQKLAVENALAKLDSDTSREGWKRLQGTLEEHVRKARTTGYITETIQKGFWQKNAKWIFILAIVIGLIFLYYYLTSVAGPAELELGEM